MKKARTAHAVEAETPASKKASGGKTIARDTGDSRRAELVEAAYSLIAEKGIEGLRTRDVAAKVGINISTFHYHFDTKEKLIAAVVAHVEHLFQTVRAPLRAGATSLDELRHMLETPTYRRRVVPELEIVVNETMLHARRNEALRATFDAMLDDWRFGVEQIVARCVRDGYVRGDLPPAVVATLIISFLMGATLQLGLRPHFPLPRVSELLLSILVESPVRAAKKPR